MTTLEPTLIVRAGGIVPTDAKVESDIRVGVVHGRRYAHPALPGKTIVRIVPEVMAPGVDVEMETLGFAQGEVSAGLGKARFRALGFPGWALVNDPAHAKFALEVMKDFKRAAKQIRSKPGNARDAFVEIGRRLARSVPHFLPSFWEEAGRRFLLEESTSFAAQSFEKARQAEKEHALAIDEEARSAAYLEFALAGALPAKSLSGYAKELEEAYGAETAYARYLELATRRVLGGMPPWTGLAKELRALAKGAKKDLDAEDGTFLAAILDAPAIASAPRELWTSYDAALVRRAKKSPGVRSRLRSLFPQPSSQGKGFTAWWFSFLGRAGALEGLAEGVGDTDLAPWLSKMIAFTGGSPALLALVPELGPRLAREGKPVSVLVAGARRAILSIDFAETLLEVGASVADPKWEQFDLAQPMTVDPVRIEADPVLGPHLLAAVESVLGAPAFEAAAKEKQGLIRARRAWLAREVARLSTGGLFGVGEACARLAAKVHPELWAEHPDLALAAQSTDIAAALARTLRGGVFAEWTWPVFEELHKRGTHTLDGAWPFPIFRTATKAVVLGADEILLEHDFVLPPKARVNRCLFIDGDLFVAVAAPAAGMRGYWASSPHDLFELADHLYWHDFPVSVTLADGSVTFGDRAIHRGDRSIKVGSPVSGDGTNVWTSARAEGRYQLFELDPKTGTRGRASWPKFVEAAMAEEDGLRILSVSLAPAPNGVEKSPLGQKDGLVGVVLRGPESTKAGVRQLCRIDGARWQGEGLVSPRALMSWPGDAVLRPAFGRRVAPASGLNAEDIQLEDGEGAVFASLGESTTYRAGWPSVPHLALWCFLRPRDEGGSRALRAVDPKVAEGLIATSKTGASLEGVTAPALGEAIASLARRAEELRGDLAKLGVGERNPAPVMVSLTDTLVQDALAVFLEPRWSPSLVSEEIAAMSEAALGVPARRFSPSKVHWERFVARLRGLAVFAMLPATSTAHRDVIARLLRVFAPTVFAIGTREMRVFVGHIAPGSPLKPTDAQAWTVMFEGSTFVLRTVTPLANGSANDGWPITAIELRTDTSFLAPPGLTISETRTVARVDETAFLAGFAEIVPQGPPAWEPAAAETFAAATGLSRAEATLVLAGLPNFKSYASDFLGKELREKLGLKSADAKMARDTLMSLPKEKLLEAFARGAPADARDLAKPWTESGLAESIGRAFADVFGTRVTLRDEIVAACERELDPPLASATLLTAVASERAPAFLQPPRADFDALFLWQSPPPSNVLSSSALASLAGLVAWLYFALPAGDPYRDAVPRVMSAIDRLLEDPALVLPLRHFSVDRANVPALRSLLASVMGEPAKVTMIAGPSESAVDSGAFIAAIFREGHMGAVAFRPAKARPEDPIGRAVAAAPLTSGGAGTDVAWNAVALLRSPGLRAIVLRIAQGDLAPGAYEANPAASLPALVATVAKAKKLSADAACHYLQLLGLAEPTARSVQLWNGWKPAQYKKSCQELVAKKLVVTGKRERAGREVFLPGAWEKGKDKGLPTEGWKKALYATSASATRTLPARPLSQIWTEAWTRIEAGDIPRLEEV